MNLKDKKWIYALLLVVLIILIFLITILSQNNTGYILIDGITKLKYENGNYQLLTSNKEFLQDKMMIYNSYGKVGEYEIYKTDDELLRYTNFTLGNKYIAFLNLNEEISTFEITELDQDNLKVLKTLLKEYGIEKYTNLFKNEQVIYDIDKDGFSETIISVSNYSFDSNDAKYFNFVYVIDDDEINYLVNEVYNKQDFIGNYSIEYLFCLNKKKYDIVLYYSDWDSNYHEVYQNKNGEYVKAF